MHVNIRSFVASVAESFPTVGPVHEFGSYIVPGQEKIGDLRTLFPGRKYVGCDMREGPGVDRVEDLGKLTLADNSLPMIICVETLEHVFEVRRAADELMRVLAPGGLLAISVPFSHKIHAYPDDYWRITPACLSGLLSPLAASIIGWQGTDKSPHSVFAVACKAPVPTWFSASVGKFTKAFQDRLDREELGQPTTSKLKQRILSPFTSKGERRRLREYYRTGWVTSFAAHDSKKLNALQSLKVAEALPVGAH